MKLKCSICKDDKYDCTLVRFPECMAANPELLKELKEISLTHYLNNHMNHYDSQKRCKNFWDNVEFIKDDYY